MLLYLCESIIYLIVFKQTSCTPEHRYRNNAQGQAQNGVHCFATVSSLASVSKVYPVSRDLFINQILVDI